MILSWDMREVAGEEEDGSTEPTAASSSRAQILSNCEAGLQEDLWLQG